MMHPWSQCKLSFLLRPEIKSSFFYCFPMFSPYLPLCSFFSDQSDWTKKQNKKKTQANIFYILSWSIFLVYSQFRYYKAIVKCLYLFLFFFFNNFDHNRALSRYFQEAQSLFERTAMFHLETINGFEHFNLLFVKFISMHFSLLH